VVVGVPSEPQVLESPGPFWTEKLYRPSGGQDHLGLGSVSSDRILRTLVPGINVLTVHPRYWSFYSFVLDEFWRRRLARTRRSFAGFYRPCESIYAVAAYLCDRPEHERHGPMRGVVGTDKARPYAAQAPAEFDPMYDYIDSDLGGYGLYYGTTMAATGLVIPALPQAGVPFDAPTPAGQRAAAAFREAIAGTTYYREYFGHPDRPVPAAVVLEYARAACLCQLQTDDAPDRPLLRDVFCYGGDPEEAALRRDTLRFFLDLSAGTDGVPVDQDTFRRLIYFRELGNGLRYTPRAEVARTARRWRLYQAREYYSLALNRLWALLTAWGAGRSAAGAVSVPVADWWHWLDSAMDFGPVGRELGAGDPGIGSSSPLADLADWITATAGTAANVDGIWPRDSTLTEDRLSSWRAGSPDPALAAAMIALLLLIRERVGRPARQIQIGEDMDILAAGGAERLAMTRFFDRARRAITSGATVGEFARSLVLDFVVRQHERVAMSKLPDDTFRFRRDGDRLRFSPLRAETGFNDSRFTAVSTIVAELGLAGGLESADHALTPAGTSLLTAGDLPERPLTGASDPGERA
jgi:hypothetical protein